MNNVRWLGLWGALSVLFVLSLLAGRAGLDSPSQWFAADAGSQDLARLIFWELRLPRSLLALAVGAGLGLAGAALQGLTRNPIAEPGLLGVSSGAALGAVLAIYTGLSQSAALWVPILGLAGAGLSCVLTLWLGRGGSVMTLVLAGTAVSGLLLTGTALALNLAPSPYAAYEITQWLLGSLADRSWTELGLALPFMSVGAVLLLRTGLGLNALTLGELQAQSLGIAVPRLQWQVVLGVALIVGAATSITGAIGFVGLVAPHLARAWASQEPSRVLLPAAMLGALLVLAADVLVRLLPLDRELKLGVVTSLVGAPFFLAWIMRMKREWL